MFISYCSPRLVARAVSLALGVSTLPVMASTWVGGSGDWDTASNWDSNTVPQGGGGQAYIEFDDDLDRIITYNAVSPDYLTYLALDHAGSSGSLEFDLLGAWLDAQEFVVGVNGRASVIQTATSVWAPTIVVGRYAGSDGSYRLNGGLVQGVDITLGEHAGSLGEFVWSGGALEVTGDVLVGQAGSGSFIQDAEWRELYIQYGQRLVIGEQAGGDGVFEQRSGNVFSSGAQIIVGDAGMGTYRHLDGNHYADELIIGRQSGGEGTYELSGDTVTPQDNEPYYTSIYGANRTVVGDAGTGRFIQTSGEHGSEELIIGRAAGGVGEYQLSGGELRVWDLVLGDAGGSQGALYWTGGDLNAHNLYIGRHGSGTFIYDHNGPLYLGAEQTLVLGEQAGGEGVFEQRDGLVQSGSQLIIGDAGMGTYRHLAGSHDADELIIGRQTGGEGTYELSGGTVTPEDSEPYYTSWYNAYRTVVGDAGTGRFIQTSGEHGSDELIIGRAAGGVGEYQLSGGELRVWDLVLGDTGGSQGALHWTGGDLNAHNLYIGRHGSGTFIYDHNGPLYLGAEQTLVLGEQAGGEGVFEQRDGLVQSGSQLIIGDAGMGTYRHLEGSHDAGELIIGRQAGGEGTYELSGVAMDMDGEGYPYYTAWYNASRTVVGDAGTGRFIHVAAEHRSDELIIGRSVGSSGLYELHTGRLHTINTRIAAAEGASGTVRLLGHEAQWFNSETVYVGVDLFSAPASLVPPTALLELHDGSILSAEAVIVGETGAIQSAGSINANVINNGLFAPGIGIGYADVFGNYTQLEQGTLSIELGGTDGSVQHDALNIFGDAIIGGMLSVSLLSGHDFSIGESFDILYANMVYGSFDDLLFPIFDGLTFDIFYDMNAVRLTVVSAVPVPAAAWLFGSGVVVLMGVARRRKAA
jgi:hypothetical protein